MTGPCVHRWLIEPPSGATSRGVCKLCGEAKTFRNGESEERRGPDGMASARRSVSKTAVKSARARINR